MIAPLLWLTLALAPQSPRPTEPGGTYAGYYATEHVREWRELLELDLPGQVVAEGRALVAPDGQLAREGEAIALVARALFDTEDAAAAWELIDGAQPSPETAAHLDLEKARLWIEGDQLEAAVRFLQRDEDAEGVRAPKFPESWLLLGRALARSGEPDRAVPLLERFLQMAPMHVEATSALYLLSQQALRSGDGARAQQLAQRAQELGQWHAYYRVRRLQVRETPNEPLPRLGLAQLWLRAGEPGKAIRELDALVALAPDFCTGWFHLGEAHRMRNDLPSAERAYTRALECDPTEIVARHNRAVIARMAGRAAKARADFEWLVASEHARDPRVRPAHLELARLLLAAGEQDAARARHAVYAQLGGTEPLQP
jgi:tetratricopeptide (TPR) repeat protein